MTDCSPAGRRHPVLAARHSSHRFDPTRDVTASEVESLLDAARWAPSAGNSQPWGFFLAHRDSPEHGRVGRHLAGSSRRWALDAGLLIVTAAYRHVDGDPSMPYSEFSDYDLGQAVAHLTIQAQVLGLSSHQFRAFDLDGLTAELRPHPGWDIVSMIAVGHALDEPHVERARATTHDIRTRAWDVGAAD